MSRGWVRRELQLDRIRVSVLERASDTLTSKPPMLLLHGLVAEGNTFRRLMTAMPSDRRVLALDLPGAGYSERSPKLTVSFDGMASVVLQATRALELDRPVLLGHSHGGVVALELASQHPELLDALVLLCPAHPFSGREDQLVSFYLSRVGNLFAHLLPRLPDWLHLFVFRHMPGGRKQFVAADVEPYLHTLREPGTVNHLLALLRSWKADMESLRKRMMAEPLATPTLLIWGDRDVVVPALSADALKRHLQTWEMFTLPGVGHLPNEEAPAECASIIKTWLIWRDTHWKYADSRSDGVEPVSR